MNIMMFLSASLSYYIIFMSTMKFAKSLLKPLWNLVLDHEYSFSACNVNYWTDSNNTGLP